tara:strand:- start:126 stop:242 length:117 start_codon:yes stop_codon:yes gene_type:complete
MNRIIFVIIVTMILSGCGKKSAPVYKSENHKENIILIS